MRSLIIPLSLIAVFASTSAQAEQWRPMTEKVSYGDLNLARQADVATFDARLSAAALKVCRPPYQGGQIPAEYGMRCAIAARASYARPRALALAAAQTRTAAAATPIVVAAR